MYFTAGLVQSSRLCTLGADGLRHGAGVPEPLSVHRPDDEQVDSIGSQVFDCELGGLHVICHSLPAVAHRLTVEGAGLKGIH